jgi:hypothetical protein
MYLTSNNAATDQIALARGRGRIPSLGKEQRKILNLKLCFVNRL